MPAIFTFPNRILFGDGARAELPAEFERLYAPSSGGRFSLMGAVMNGRATGATREEYLQAGYSAAETDAILAGGTPDEQAATSGAAPSAPASSPPGQGPSRREIDLARAILDDPDADPADREIAEEIMLLVPPGA